MMNTKKNIKKLSDLCIDKNGIQTGPFGSQLHKKDYVDIGTPIITVEHLGENRIIHKNVPQVSHKDKVRLNKYWLQEGDIVFSRVGSVDRRSLIRKDEEGWLFSGRCLRVRPDPYIIDPEYLSWYFGLDSFKEYIRGIAVGATMPSLNTKLLSEIEIQYPPLPEQKAIANILSSLDDKIELNNRMNKTLEEMAQAIFTRWFVDFEFPFDFEKEEPAPGGKPYKSSGGKMVESEMGLIPEGWGLRKLMDITSYINRGITPKYNNDSNEIVLNQRCIRDFRIHMENARKHEKKVPSEKYVQFGDVLINSTGVGTLGRVAQIYEYIPNCTVDSHVTIVRVDNKDYINYFGLLLMQMEYYFDHQGIGSTGQTELKRSVIEETEVIFPSCSIAKMFDDYITPLRNKIIKNTKENQTLTSIRDSLLPKLMSGDLRVPDHMIEKYKETSPEPAGADG